MVISFKNPVSFPAPVYPSQSRLRTHFLTRIKTASKNPHQLALHLYFISAYS